jgi:hypothetical protein
MAPVRPSVMSPTVSLDTINIMILSASNFTYFTYISTIDHCRSRCKGREGPPLIHSYFTYMLLRWTFVEMSRAKCVTCEEHSEKFIGLQYSRCKVSFGLVCWSNFERTSTGPVVQMFLCSPSQNEMLQTVRIKLPHFLNEPIMGMYIKLLRKLLFLRCCHV